MSEDDGELLLSSLSIVRIYYHHIHCEGEGKLLLSIVSKRAEVSHCCPLLPIVRVRVSCHHCLLWGRVSRCCHPLLSVVICCREHIITITLLLMRKWGASCHSHPLWKREWGWGVVHCCPLWERGQGWGVVIHYWECIVIIILSLTTREWRGQGQGWVAVVEDMLLLSFCCCQWKSGKASYCCHIVIHEWESRGWECQEPVTCCCHWQENGEGEGRLSMCWHHHCVVVNEGVRGEVRASQSCPQIVIVKGVRERGQG